MLGYPRANGLGREGSPAPTSLFAGKCAVRFYGMQGAGYG